ncbi:hypothetical protein [Phytohalomonas tamaricis]|uniref:hypothetical protein n=1 Tax=Phytohalomonas tamaricis TaxID=2081032 RepID=UPI000D0BB7A9|nr:hypothetical protein [Phytohalomonas tamaricis]
MTAQVKLYTPNQVRAGTFFGGPLVAVYFIYLNFKHLERHQEAGKTLNYGAMFIVLITAFSLLASGSASTIISIFVSVGYTLVAGAIVERKQLSKTIINDEARYSAYSNWRVAGATLAGLIVYMLVLLLLVSLLSGS